MMSDNPVHEKSYILEKLMELAYDGIVVIDQQGIITLLSKAYADFLGISVDDAIGKPVIDVIENTRLPAVLKSGREERGKLQKIHGDYMVASRMPLIKDGQVVGAIGKVLFRKIDELNGLHKRISQLQQQLEEYRQLTGSHQSKYSFQQGY